MRLGTYYMARVIKLGELNQDRLLDAIVNAPTVQVGDFEWTITDVTDGRREGFPFVFGKLAKYSKDGQVTVVDEAAKHQFQALAENLLEASAPFVYLPEFSGLAFLHASNGIRENVFPHRFKTIIEAAYDNFFVNCTVEPVMDYRAFLRKLSSLDMISELSATVYPPNPLFGRLWGSLEKYVKKRHADKVSVKEESKKPGGLVTQLPAIIEGILEDPNYEPLKWPEITDTAMLMAADGYGTGKAVGTANGEVVVVRTSDSPKSFKFEKDPYPDVLAITARKRFADVSFERDMGH